MGRAQVLVDGMHSHVLFAGEGRDELHHIVLSRPESNAEAEQQPEHSLELVPTSRPKSFLDLNHLELQKFTPRPICFMQWTAISCYYSRTWSDWRRIARGVSIVRPGFD